MRSDYAAFAREVAATGRLWDPWFAGQPRLQAEPERLAPATYRALVTAAEQIAAVHEELAQLVAADDALLDEFFAPTAAQRAMWVASAPQWHGIARADVFDTADGPRVCELNSDTPSGQAEAVVLTQLAAARTPDAIDPNAQLGAATVAMVEAFGRSVAARGPLAVGIVYPTEMTEDLSMVALYREWLEARGHRVALGSPFNLARARDGRATLLDTPCDVVVRHYKTDWWGERQPVRDDEPAIDDAAPLARPLADLLLASLERRTAVVNPFGAVVTQNKRALALCWEEIDRFSAPAQAAIRRHLPRTVRLELAREQLWHERARWVLKSDFGCEGSEVVVGAATTEDEWHDVLDHAIAQRWVAQQRFDATVAADGMVTNHGVYVVGGRAAGLFARRHEPIGPGGRGITDATARCVPVLINGEVPA